MSQKKVDDGTLKDKETASTEKKEGEIEINEYGFAEASSDKSSHQHPDQHHSEDNVTKKEDDPEGSSQSPQDDVAQEGGQPHKWVIGLLIILFILIGFAVQQIFFTADKPPLYIAVSGPMSGKSQINGEAMINGIQLCLDEVNEQGGIEGHPVKLLTFDDKNQPTLAKQAALQIAENQNPLAVIGHYGSSTSIAAAPVYQQQGIAAISGSSTADQLTEGNDWYFRTIFNNSDQASLLANYVYKVLKYNSANIFFDEDAYGSTLASTFYRQARLIGLEIDHQWHFNSKDSFQVSLQQLTETLASNPNEKTVLFLATHSTEAVETLVALKELEDVEVEIIGADALSSANFVNKLRGYQKEKIQPGYYSDGVYAIAPLLFDLGNKLSQEFRLNFAKQYQEKPSVTSAIYYDAALVVVDALRKMVKAGIPPTLEQQRQQIKKALWQLNKLENGLEGITATLYFDQHGNAIKPIPMGVYKNGALVAAMWQYQPLQSVQNIDDLLQKMLTQQIVEINNKFMSLARVVYAGLDFTDISELNAKDSTFTADFYLWFRYQGEFDDSNIELINLFKPMQSPLGEPISVWHSDEQPDITTRTYRLKTKFKVSLDLRNYPLDQQELGIYFRHNNLTKDKLIYVVDVQGMQLDKSLAEQKEAAKAFFSIGGWFVNHVSFFQKNQTNDSTWGITDFFNTKQRIEYSQFNSVVSINRQLLNFILKSLLPVIFLVMLGYISFFVTAFSSKLGIGTNLILATSLFHLKLASELPNINYIVLIEYFFYLIYLLALFIIIITIITHLYEEDETKKVLVNRLNLAGKIIYPLLLLGFVVVITYQNYDLIMMAI